MIYQYLTCVRLWQIIPIVLCGWRARFGIFGIEKKGLLTAAVLSAAMKALFQEKGIYKFFIRFNNQKSDTCAKVSLFSMFRSSSACALRISFPGLPRVFCTFRAKCPCNCETDGWNTFRFQNRRQRQSRGCFCCSRKAWWRRHWFASAGYTAAAWSRIAL